MKLVELLLQEQWRQVAGYRIRSGRHCGHKDRERRAQKEKERGVSLGGEGGDRRGAYVRCASVGL